MACMLGGEDRRTLSLMTAVTSQEDVSKGNAKGFVETARGEVAGAGMP